MTKEYTVNIAYTLKTENRLPFQGPIGHSFTKDDGTLGHQENTVKQCTSHASKHFTYFIPTGLNVPISLFPFFTEC